MDSRRGFENPQENANFEQNVGLLDSCSWNPDLSRFSCEIYNKWTPHFMGVQPHLRASWIGIDTKKMGRE
jgi:hypothetical protein